MTKEELIKSLGLKENNSTSHDLVYRDNNRLISGYISITQDPDNVMHYYIYLEKCEMNGSRDFLCRINTRTQDLFVECVRNIEKEYDIKIMK